MKNPRILFMLAVMSVLISNCQSQSIDMVEISPKVVPTSVTNPTAASNPTIVMAATATSIPVQNPAIVSPKSCSNSNGPLPSLSNPEGPSIRPVDSSLGGGLVQSKEFTIELLLYCDFYFQPNSNDINKHSDINGLAVYHNWRYDASNESGIINIYYGIEPNIRWQSGQGPSTNQGHVAQGQSTGLLFDYDVYPDFSKKVSLDFVYIIQTASGQLSGATLSFNLEQVSDGLQPSTIIVAPLSDKELESIKVALPPAPL